LTALELDPGLPSQYRELQLQRWGARSLTHWLDDIQMPTTTEEERERIIDATGGWPVLLGSFLQLAHTHDHRLEPTLAALAADERWAARLVSDLALDRACWLRSYPRADP
jgi:hypothetical protein